MTGTVAGLSRPSTDAAMVALLAAVLLAASWTGTPQPLRGGFEATLAAWLALVFLSAAFAPCFGRGVHLAVQFAAAAALFCLMRGWRPEFCARAMALVATGAAGFGLVVYLLGYTPRVTAPFGQHHYAAGFLLLHSPLTASLARQRRVWGWAAALESVAVIGTRSLAGIFVLALLGLWVLRRHRVLLIGLAAAMLLALLPSTILPRVRALITRGEDPSLSLENRLRYLRTGVAMLAQGGSGFRQLGTRNSELGTLLWGWGLGSVPLVAARYRPQVPDVMPQGEALPHLHNLPVNLAAETGLLGLTLGAWLLWRVRSPALLAYAVFALFDYQLDVPAILLPLAAVAALSAAPREPSAGVSRGPAGELAKAKPVIVALRIIFLLAALVAPFQSRCGWEDFERGSYVTAAARLPDLIPVSAAAGAELVDAGQPARAIPYLERAAALDAYFTLAYFHLGRARAITGDRRGAVEALSRALLVQPVTIFAEGWDPELYRPAVQGALQKLDSLSQGVSFDRRSRHRHAELRAFLEANVKAPPWGPYRRTFSEITDADLAHNTSLLIFHRAGLPRYTSPVNVLLPKPDFYIPPGIGYLRGLPETKAF